jgi:hypothetical protein
MTGEGLELLLSLTDEQVGELVRNTEVTCLILHSKPWKYYALVNVPYRALKIHKQGGGRYEWLDITENLERYFETRVVRLRDNWKEILGEAA